MDKASTAEAWDRALAEQLRAEITNNARTQAAIAEGAGMSSKTLRRYMDGERSITVQQLRRVLAEIQLSLDVFLARVDQRTAGF